MSNFKQSDFVYEEDCVINAECKDCGNTFDIDDEDEICPECEGNNLIYETSHEGCECALCKCTFDMYVDGYRHNKDNDILICTDCYEELEELEE